MTEPTDAELGKLAEECGIGWGAGLGGMSDFLSAFARAVLAKWAARATQQAGATKEHVRLVRVIADKIEDGTLFRSGIYSNKDLARFVRNVADAAAPQFPTTQAQADSVLEDAAFEAVRKKLCALPRYSFVLDDDGVVRRVQDRTGNWIEFDEAHALLDPVAVDAARKQGGQHGAE